LNSLKLFNSKVAFSLTCGIVTAVNSSSSPYIVICIIKYLVVVANGPKGVQTDIGAKIRFLLQYNMVAKL